MTERAGRRYIPGTALAVTVSGSFHRHLDAVALAVAEFKASGALVLSPVNPVVTGALGEFILLASDPAPAILPTQSRHLQAISLSHLLWVVAPDGYVGISTAMEIGTAVALGVPVFAERCPIDSTLQEFVTPASSPAAALSYVRRSLARTR